MLLTTHAFQCKHSYKLGWLNLPHSRTLPPTVTVKQSLSGQIPGTQPEQRIDGYGGKDFETTRVICRVVKETTAEH